MRSIVLTAVVLLVVACGNPARHSSASEPRSAQERASGESGGTIRMEDDCDPASFNAAIGAGTCVGPGETTFPSFIAELKATRVAEDWKFDDDHISVAPGASFTSKNAGGETHSFTRVQAFGGGFVPVLNQLSGNPVVAPECQFPGVAPSLVPAGGSLTVKAPASGTVKYQCCIHPWMRAVVTVGGD